MRLEPELVADDLLTIRFSGQREAELAARVMREQGRWIEVVSGVNCVVLQFDNLAMNPDDALSACVDVVVPDEPVDTTATIDIPVCYDARLAPDLEPVCEQLGISEARFVEYHSGAGHAVRMLGFMPGFAYLDGLDPALAVGRLEQPRQRVAAGSIAIAGNQTGIYALQSPGGWRVVGRTPMVLFDARRDPPAVLQSGQNVRFRPISYREFRDMASQ